MKQDIRSRMIARREALSSGESEEAARLLAERLRDLPSVLWPGGAGRRLQVACYASIRGEASLAWSWAVLAAWPADLYFPAVSGHGKAAGLVFGRLPEGLAPETFLVPGRFGVAEPPPQSWLNHPPHFDLLLIPGVAFDRQGGRLGWGQGFYDRLLQSLPGHPPRVGVAHEFQIVPEPLPLTPGDEPMDWLLTPRAIIHIDHETVMVK
jgi:5-formyltetrahydrofolate cyclo-ligase